MSYIVTVQRGRTHYTGTALANFAGRGSDRSTSATDWTCAATAAAPVNQIETAAQSHASRRGRIPRRGRLFPW